MTNTNAKPRRILWYFTRWFDATTIPKEATHNVPMQFSWVGTVPYVFMHLGCLGVIWVGWSWAALAVALFLYFLRTFAITAFYHRYFSHRAFRTSRPAQFIFAVLGNTAVQRGPLWWAARHRHHHAHSDEAEDVHSPIEHGFSWAHMGWLTSPATLPTDLKMVPDLAKFPELRFIERFELLVPALLAGGLYGFGALLNYVAPGLGTSGLQMLVWGFFISTVVVFHLTCTINSLAHLWGRRRYATKDHSRNNWILALLTFGEGWHNNHHYYPSAGRQGFFWWEIDVSYYLLRVLAWMGIIWDLREVPAEVLEPGRQRTEAAQAA